MKARLPYTDEELKDILHFSPTKDNIKRLAEKYLRSESALKENK